MFRPSSLALYLCDNGRCLCGDHLGASAKYTGRDISGQSIHKISPSDVREADAMGVSLVCEEPRCGRAPSRLVAV